MITDIQFSSVSSERGNCMILVVMGGKVNTLAGTYNQNVQRLVDRIKFAISIKEGEISEEIDPLYTQLVSAIECEEKIQHREKVSAIEEELQEISISLKKEEAPIREQINHRFTPLLESYPDYLQVLDKSSSIVSFCRVGTEVAMPYDLLEAILKRHEKSEDVKALFLMWDRCLMCPYPDTRNDIFKFCKAQGIRITSGGLLIGYRKANVLRNGDPIHPHFVVEQYNLAKQHKKGVKSHAIVVEVVSNDYNLDGPTKTKAMYKPLHYTLTQGQEWYANKATLDTLHQEYSNDVSKTVFKAQHFGAMSFSVGDVYKQSIRQCDPNRNAECSRGLHFGNIAFGLNGFGTDYLGVLVCPSKIVSVPYADHHKARSSEMYIFNHFESMDSLRTFHESGDILEYETDYLKIQEEEIDKILSKMNLKEYLGKDHFNLDYMHQIADTRGLHQQISELRDQLNGLTDSQFVSTTSTDSAAYLGSVASILANRRKKQ